MKKALVYIGGPKQLEDFIWLYLFLGEGYEWTLICQPMYPEMGLKNTCEASKLFKNIIMVDAYITKSKFILAIEFCKMFFYWAIGKSTFYAKREIKKIINLEEYETVVVPTTRGVTSGMLVLAADCDNIILTEDGMGDIVNPDEKLSIREWGSFIRLGEYISSKLGYFNLNGRFPLKSFNKCVKYTQYVNEVSTKLYKSVRLLNDFSKIDMQAYTSIIQRTFGTLDKYEDCCAIVFTTNLLDFTKAPEKQIKKVERYMSVKYENSNIVLKKHPRDLYNYMFEGLKIEHINPMLPAENLIDFIEDKDIYFFYPSTVVKFFLKKNYYIRIFKFTNISENYEYSFNKGLSVVTEGLDDYNLEIIKI
jgi:hypothetical protein